MEKAIFRFAHQEYLWLLVLLPVMIAVYAWFYLDKKTLPEKIR